MVSLGETAISLHILQPPLKGECSGKSKLKVPRSAYISFGGGGCSEPNSRTVCSEEFEHKICLATFWMPLHHR